MRRMVAIFLLVTVVGGATTGLAASLNVTSDQLGSGPAPVTTCDTDGVTATDDKALGLLVAVVVAGIADGSTTPGAGACDGDIVRVEALNADGNVITGAVGSNTVTGDVDALDGVVTVVLTVPPLAEAVRGVRIRITG